MQQHVIEIDRVGQQQMLLIKRVELGDDLSQRMARARFVLFGADETILGPTDRLMDTVRCDVCELDVAVFDDLFEQRQTVARVIDREILSKPDLFGVAPQESSTEAMKGADPNL